MTCSFSITTLMPYVYQCQMIQFRNAKLMFGELEVEAASIDLGTSVLRDDGFLDGIKNGNITFQTDFPGHANFPFIQTQTHELNFRQEWKQWEYPEERFTTYEPQDEEWCRYFGIGKEVDCYRQMTFDNARLRESGVDRNGNQTITFEY